MKKISILFLQVVVILIAIGTFIILAWFPLTEGRAKNLDLLSIYLDPFILFGYAASTSFFVALFQVFKLLRFIGQNKVFTSQALQTLTTIKYCAIILGISIVLSGIYIKLFHSKDDDPAGFIAICIITIFVTGVAGAAAAIFEKLLQNAIVLKTENDLTV